MAKQHPVNPSALIPDNIDYAEVAKKLTAYANRPKRSKNECPPNQRTGLSCTNNNCAGGEIIITYKETSNNGIIGYGYIANFGVVTCMCEQCRCVYAEKDVQKMMEKS